MEQKNSSLVRAYLGDLYLHTSQHLALLKPIYEDMRLYYNLHQPVLRQTERAAVVLPVCLPAAGRPQAGQTASAPLDANRIRPAPRCNASCGPAHQSAVLALRTCANHTTRATLES